MAHTSTCRPTHVKDVRSYVRTVLVSTGRQDVPRAIPYMVE
jgi:hypothetical protein